MGEDQTQIEMIIPPMIASTISRAVDLLSLHQINLGKEIYYLPFPLHSTVNARDTYLMSEYWVFEKKGKIRIQHVL